MFYRFDGEDWVTQQKIPEVGSRILALCSVSRFFISLKAHDGTVWCAAFDAEGHRLVTVGEDHVVQVRRRLPLLSNSLPPLRIILGLLFSCGEGSLHKSSL